MVRAGVASGCGRAVQTMQRTERVFFFFSIVQTGKLKPKPEAFVVNKHDDDLFGENVRRGSDASDLAT
jgi:hypothetical protein